MTADQYHQLSSPVTAVQYRDGMDCGELHIAIDHLTDGKSRLRVEYPGRVPYVASAAGSSRLTVGCWVVAKHGGGHPTVYTDDDFRKTFIPASTTREDTP